MASNWRNRTADLTVSALGRLIAHMALDEVLHRRFLDHPDQVIADAGLSADEVKALNDGDWAAIGELLGPRPRPLPHQRPSGGSS